MKKKYLKIVFNEWANASRDKRELGVAEEEGYQTLVIATTKAGKTILQDNVSGFKVIRIPTRVYGNNKTGIFFSRIHALCDFISVTKKQKADVISGHNYTGLLIGYIANKLQSKKNRAKLIYDSHEFELYQITRSKFKFVFVKMIEGFLVRRSDINMMVSDGIADEVQKIYGLKKRPAVVRNIPDKWKLDDEKIDRIKKEYISNLNINDDGTILLYHGMVAKQRKIENIIQGLSGTENTGLVILGMTPDQGYIDGLKKLIETLRLEKRVYFHPAVELEQLCNYVAAADASVIILQKSLKSYYYSLPNKFFESIQALTPVICNDLPEMKKIIKKYDIGLIVNGDKGEELTDRFRWLSEDRFMYQTFKENLRKAKEELCWENEKSKLSKLIKELEVDIEQK